MWNEFRVAFRSLKRSPVFTLVAVTTLALGIAANTAIFSLFYQVLVRSLPVPEPERLVLLHSSPPWFPGSMSSDNNETAVSYPLYRRLRDAATQFKGLAARSGATVEISRQSGNDRVGAEVISGNYFQVLGVKPRLGRLITPSDDQTRGGDAVAVLSYAYWNEHMGASSAALNQTVLVNGHPFVVVGVAARGFHGLLADQNPAIFVPISMKNLISPGWTGFDDPQVQWLNVVGRLNSGITKEQATSALRPAWTAIVRDQISRMKLRNEGMRQKLLAKTVDFRAASKGINQLEGQWKKPLWALLAMVGLLLLIACGNVANLVVARAVSRTRETAVRVALGADRWRVVRQSLAESLILSLAGGLIGTALSYALVGLLLRLVPSDLAGHWLTASPDTTVLGFSLLLVLLATVFFGLLPAVQASLSDPMPALKEQSSSTSASGAHTRWRRALVVAQLSLSLCLLVGAGLFATTLLKLLSQDPGFRPSRLVTFAVNPALSGYSIERGRTLYREALASFARLPEVEGVSLAEIGPLSHDEAMTNVTVEGYHPQTDEDEGADVNTVSADYFRTIGTALQSGREFTPRDREGAPKVAVVNEAFVRHFFAGRNPIGMRMEIGAGKPPDMIIVGVVKDARTLNLRDPSKPTFYSSLEQSYAGAKQIRPVNVYLRTRQDERSLERNIRAVMRALDPNLPVSDIRAMNDVVNESIYTDRLSAALSVAFGILAIILAAVGLYGVVAYSVLRRTTEIGIRLALGAMPQQVRRLILSEVLLMAALGVAIGLPAAYFLARLMKSQLFGIGPNSTTIFLLATLTVLVSALAAGIIPAWRASTVDPKEALRYE